MKPCSLDMPTQALMKLIFDNDMFQDAMKSLEIGGWVLYMHNVHLYILMVLEGGGDANCQTLDL